MSDAARQQGERTEEDREFDAISELDIWDEARDRLESSKNAESSNRQSAKEAIRFRAGDQWDHATTTTESEDEPELTINLTDALCMRVENNIRQQRPRGKCHPVGDGADIELAEVFNGIGRHIETRSEAGVAYDTAASCAITAGWGYFRLLIEYVSPKSFQRDMRIVPIRNVFSVNMDPSAVMPSGADQGWCIISTKMRRVEYKRRYPKASNANWVDVGGDATRLDWEDREEVRLAEYLRIREIPSRLYLIRGAGGEEFTRYQNELPRDPRTRQLLPLLEVEAMLAERGLRIDGDRESSKRQVEWFRLNGRTIVAREQLPGQYIPVFRVENRATMIDDKMLRTGMVAPMIDAARMVNYGEVAKIKRLGLTPKAPWVGPEGSFEGHDEWDDANKKPYSKLEYKPIVIETSAGPMLAPAPQRQMPAQIEQGFSEFVQGMRSNLMAVAGMPNEPGQDQMGIVVSGKAIDRRQWLSDQAHFHVYDNLTLAIAQCWRVIVELAPFVYVEKGRMQRVIGEDSVPQIVQLNSTSSEQNETGEAITRAKNDLSVGRYDVVMDTGPGYETKREEGAQNLIDMVKIPALAELVAKIAPDLLFRAIDHPYMQELADRLSASTPDGLKKVMGELSSRARSLVQSLANENAQLKQQIQTLQQDLKGGITKAHLAAATKAHDTNVMAGVKLHDTEVRSDTQKQVAEITAGGKIIDSRAQRGHETDQLARQLEHGAAMALSDQEFQRQEKAADRLIAQPPQQQPSNGSGA